MGSITWLDEWVVGKIAKRTDVNPKAGTAAYGSVRFADERNKKYPLSSESHVRAALAYFSMPKNRSKYSSADQGVIMGRIRAAARKYGIKLSEDK